MSCHHSEHEQTEAQYHPHELIPEVSLISSWYIPMPPDEEPTVPQPPKAITLALQEGIGLLDLYFLDASDIPWYINASNIDAAEGWAPLARHEFTSRLVDNALTEGPTNNCLLRIADRLKALLVDCYSGRLVGRRPRIAALATFFPHISVPCEFDEDTTGQLRRDAVQAVRAALYLARCLGCRCVEIVGGAGVPTRHFTGRDETSDAYREKRLRTFIQSIKEIFDRTDKKNILKYLPEDEVPYVALELEPGPSFLLNKMEVVNEVFRRLGADTTPKGRYVNEHVRLCVDIAHAFLLGYTYNDLLADGLIDRVGHIHCSDHAGDLTLGGAHASDLPPGSCHLYFENDDVVEQYQSWIRLAVERMLTGGQWFSGAVAIELEATNSLKTVRTAISTVRRWLLHTAKTLSLPVPDPLPGTACAEGVILSLDIGNSTKYITSKGDGFLKTTIEGLCEIIHKYGGSVMTFTGDGFIALFERPQFIKPEDAAYNALLSAVALCAKITADYPDDEVTSRIALHWGKTSIPPAGRLLGEVIGIEVARTVRLCQWLSNTLEPALPQKQRGRLIGVTDSFFQKMANTDQERSRLWGKIDLKGFEQQETIYLIDIALLNEQTALSLAVK